MSVRVKICLKNIFKDYRKEAFVYVDPNFKNVLDFEKHILKLFNIRSGIYLTIGNSLLPSDESARVIHSGDVIIVNKSVDEKSNGTETSIESSSEFHHIIEIENQSSDEVNSTKRGKRIRKRKRKQTTAKDVDIPESSKAKALESKLIAQPRKVSKERGKLLTELTENVRLSSEKINSHIRFSNDVTDVPMTRISGPTNHLEDLQARVIRPVVVLNDAAEYSVPPDKPVTIKSDGASIPEWTQGLISLKEYANDGNNFTKVATSIDFEGIIKNIDNSNKFVTLKDALKTYDVVGFKMLKIGKNYEPQMSEWIIAMVKDVEDLDVTLHVLAGKDETSCPDGKLSMDICEDETESSDMITLALRDMLNVKLFLDE